MEQTFNKISDTKSGYKRNGGIVYKETKVRGRKKVEVSVRLNDECGNRVCDFSITGMIWEKAKNGVWIEAGGGCCHDQILRWWPEFRDFVDLHLSNLYGQPMYPTKNGPYIIREKGINEGAKYLRITTALARQLDTFEDDEDYFAYQLYALGIIEQWEREAKAAIAHLEALTGFEFVNPYKPEEERFVLRLSDEKVAKVKADIEKGLYTPKAIMERIEAKRKAVMEKERKAIEDRFDETIKKAKVKKEIFLYLFDTLGTTDNIIYYDHTNTVVFNWSDPQFSTYKKKWTQEEFVDFVNSVDMKHFPRDCKFEIKNIYK